MAIRLITGRLQQGSRYCAKEQQISMQYTLQFMVATTCCRKHKLLYYTTWTVVAGWR